MVHNRTRVSPSRTRLLATALAVALLGLASAAPAAAAPTADDTWTALASLPDPQDRPVLALAVNPTDGRQLLVGTAGGQIYRSTDGGDSWRLVKAGLGRGVVTLAFNPLKPGLVLAGTRGSGVWRSSDAGATWQLQPGTETRSARAFGFAKSMTLAGTDQGVLVNREGTPWSSSGLSQVTVSALAVAAVNEPSRFVVGGDGTRGTEPLPLFSSADGGQTWSAAPGSLSGSSMVAMLTAGPLLAQQAVRPLLLGTNTGLFMSVDNGGTWQQLTGGGVLPATDFTAAGFVANRSERFYVASDGGSSELGGLWSTTDAGAHFSSLKPPLPAVTALAVSNDETPTIYVATYRGSDHGVLLWAYRDTGGQPQGPSAGVPAPTTKKPPGQSPSKATAGTHGSWLPPLLTGPEAPYLGIGAAAFLVLLVALVTHFRRARRL